MPSPIQNLIAALTGKAQPKAESVEVTCPSCGHTFDVDVDDNNDNESWRTDDESGDVGESDPDDGDDDSEFEDSMNTPKQKAAEAAELTKALLNVASDRDSVAVWRRNPGKSRNPVSLPELITDSR